MYNKDIELPYKKLSRVDSLDAADQEFERLETDIADMYLKLNESSNTLKYFSVTPAQHLTGSTVQIAGWTVQHTGNKSLIVEVFSQFSNGFESTTANGGKYHLSVTNLANYLNNIYQLGTILKFNNSQSMVLNNKIIVDIGVGIFEILIVWTPPTTGLPNGTPLAGTGFANFIIETRNK